MSDRVSQTPRKNAEKRASAWGQRLPSACFWGMLCFFRDCVGPGFAEYGGCQTKSCSTAE